MGGTPGGVVAQLRRGTILGDRTLEYLALILDFDGGTRSATISASMLGVQAANLTQYVGGRGTLWTLDQRTIHISRHPGVTQAGARAPDGLESRTLECPPAGDPTAASLQRFAADIAGEGSTGPRGCSFAEGALALAVSAAAVTAAAEGRRVPLSEAR